MNAKPLTVPRQCQELFGDTMIEVVTSMMKLEGNKEYTVLEPYLSSLP